MTISSISNTATGTTASTTTASTPASISSSTTQSSAAAVSLATTLAANSSVVATLGGSTSGLGTYSALGLLNSFESAGTSSTDIAVPTVGSDVSAAAQLANDAGVVGTLTTSDSTAEAGTYSATGTLQNLPASVTSTYSDLLASNPSLASTFVGASYSGGIISTIA